jgi:hypothetical protein
MKFSLNKTMIEEDNKFSFNIKINNPGELIGEFVIGTNVVNLAKIQVATLVPSLIPPPEEKVIQKLTGTPFGTSPAWNNGTETFDKAFDDNVNTFFDYQNSDGGYTGIDLGENKASKITLIRYYPRSGFPERMIGGKFQGSNTLRNNEYVDLYAITNQPEENVFTEIAIKNTNSYRYLLYISPNGSYCNVSEIEFYGEVQKITS